MIEIASLYDSLDDPSYLLPFLRDVGTEFSACNVGMGIVGPQFKSFLSTNGDLESQQAYLDNVESDPWMLAGIAMGSLLPSVIDGEMLVPKKIYKSTDFYQRFMKPSGIDKVLAPVELNLSSSIMLPINRSIRQSDFDTADKKKAAVLAKHVIRFGKVFRQINTEQNVTRESVTITSRGIYRIGDIVSSTIFSGDLFSLRGNKLTLKHAELDRVFQEMISNCLKRNFEKVGRQTISLYWNHDFYSVAVFPKVVIDRSFNRMPAALVLIKQASQRFRSSCVKWQLTEAESRLCTKLGMGWDLSGIAKSENKSLYTTRTQLKMIFNKSEQRSQSALVSTLHLNSEQALPYLSTTEGINENR
ncbi:MAG: hypothetical protein AAF541_13740 [Pseudomonadota bacterium]